MQTDSQIMLLFLLIQIGLLYYNQQRLTSPMQKLFALSFRRIASRLNQAELNALNVAQALQNSKIPPSGESFLYRLPREELKHILNISCPINSLQDPSTPTIVAASKALRHHAKIREEKICAKCSFRQNCLSAKQTFNGPIDNTPKDLLIFWSGLSSLVKQEQVFYRHWVSAYKLGDNIIAGLDDLAQGGKQIEQFQKLRLFMLQQNIQNHKPSQGSQAPKENQTSEAPKQTQKAKKKTANKTNGQDDLTTNQTERNPQRQPNLQQQILGRDFSFDEVEQFEPETKFNKDTFKQKRQPRENKNYQPKPERVHKFIERNQNSKFDKPKYGQNKQNRSRQYQQDDEMPRYKGKNYRSNSDNQYERRPNYENKRNDYNGAKRYRNQQNFERQPRQQNYKKFNKKYDNRRNSDQEQSFNQRGNNYRGGNQRSDNYQNKNYDQRRNPREEERQFIQRRPNRNYQQNQDPRGPRKYQNEDNQPQRNQRQQKKTDKPNPFVSKWNASQDFDISDFKEFKQPKTRKPQNEGNEQRRQAREQPPAKPAVRIIQTQNIQDRNQGQGRGGRNVRRRPRSTSNPNQQTKSE